MSDQFHVDLYRMTCVDVRTQQQAEARVAELSALWKVPLHYWACTPTNRHLVADKDGQFVYGASVWFRAERRYSSSIPLEATVDGNSLSASEFCVGASKISPLNVQSQRTIGSGGYPLFAAIDFSPKSVSRGLLFFRPNQLHPKVQPPRDWDRSTLLHRATREEFGYHKLTNFLSAKQPNNDLQWVAWLHLETLENLIGIKCDGTTLCTAIRAGSYGRGEGYFLHSHVEDLQNEHVESCGYGVARIFGYVPVQIEVKFLEWQGYDQSNRLVSYQALE